MYPALNYRSLLVRFVAKVVAHHSEATNVTVGGLERKRKRHYSQKRYFGVHLCWCVQDTSACTVPVCLYIRVHTLTNPKASAAQKRVCKPSKNRPPPPLKERGSTPLPHMGPAPLGSYRGSTSWFGLVTCSAPVPRACGQNKTHRNAA